MTQRRGVQIRCRGCGKAVWSYDIYDEVVLADGESTTGVVDAAIVPMHTIHDPDPQSCGPVDGGTV